MNGRIEKAEYEPANFAQRVRDGASVVWQCVKGACLRAGRFVSNHFIKFFLAFWIGASVWVFFWVVDLANPCRGTTLVCPDVQWIRPGYLAEDFRNLLWAASLVFGGAGAGAALINALRRTRLMQDEHTLKQSEHRLSQRGQDAETFSRAVNQLGSDQTAVRLGAIYALESLMRGAFAEGGDKAFGRQIGETLAAFVREQSAEGMGKEAVSQNLKKQEEGAQVASGRSRLAVDREAAVVALARSWPFDFRPKLYLDRGVDLSGAQLENLRLPQGADLRGFDFSDANLRNSRLERADLQDVWFFEADLVEARLNWANLHGASIENAKFHEAKFFGTDISDLQIGIGDRQELSEEQIRVARWRQHLPPLLSFELILPHRGDGKPIDDESPFGTKWMTMVGPHSAR
ncbi:pentapeptide repeat-containing protein [Glycocaulis sp.]